MPIILLVDDHDLIRIGLIAVLERLSSTELTIHECRTLQQASSAYVDSGQAFDLVILDLNLPDTKGLAGLRSFKAQHPDAKVVVLSGSVDDAISAEACSLGAIAFLHKSTNIDALGTAILSHLSNNPPAFEQDRSNYDPTSPEAKRMSLTSKEIEVLNLVLQGLSNQEIVDTTGLKLGTVKNYISVLLTTFGVNSRTKLVSLFH